MTNPTIDKEGKRWRNSKGQYHRLDGPAWEGVNGDKAWFQNGEWHREDGPALEWYGGRKEWYIKGRRIT